MTTALYLFFLTKHIYASILGLAGMELIFPIAAPTGLCFVLVAGRMLIRHQYFGYYQAVLEHHQHCLSNITHTHSSRLRVGKILEGDRARTADLN